MSAWQSSSLQTTRLVWTIPMYEHAVWSLTRVILSVFAGTEDAGEWLETKMVWKGYRGWSIPLHGRLLGGKRAGEMGWLSRYIWRILRQPKAANFNSVCLAQLLNYVAIPAGVHMKRTTENISYHYQISSLCKEELTHALLSIYKPRDITLWILKSKFKPQFLTEKDTKHPTACSAFA